MLLKLNFSLLQLLIAHINLILTSFQGRLTVLPFLLLALKLRFSLVQLLLSLLELRLRLVPLGFIGPQALLILLLALLQLLLRLFLHSLIPFLGQLLGQRLQGLCGV
ncbi:unknown [Firmicutes bacterium CAG:137]|nr:unknown [Firmicutes bacterium CAG:137]